MDLFDALNPMALSVWPYGRWLGRYSEKCFQFPPTMPHKLMKTLNISMSSCANPNRFRWNSSARSTLYFIPYNCLEQTTPSWSAGQLKSSKSAKTANINRKTSTTSWVLVRSDWFLICYVALDLLYNEFHIIVLIRELLPRAMVIQSPFRAKFFYGELRF